MRRTVCIISLTVVLSAVVAALLTSCGAGANSSDKQGRLLILGFDGMDPRILGPLMESGRMPNFARVAARGSYLPLGTSMPPQSPVAWSNFITGAHSGVHQIYDFVHRHPDTPEPQPFLSTAEVLPAKQRWWLPFEYMGWFGDYHIPLLGGETANLRKGHGWWEYLVAHGIDTTVYRVPANYPPDVVSGSGEFRCITGMGTPDLLGTYGEFTEFSQDAPLIGKTVSGGRIEYLLVQEHEAELTLTGPENFLRVPHEKREVPKMAVKVRVVRDPEDKAVKLTVGDELLVLNEGEWSDWIPIEFETHIPGATVLGAMTLPVSMPATVRFYIKQVHPKLSIYVTPLNIDPLDPVNPISTPVDFAAEVAEACGRYYTTGIPEDTAALRCGALDEDEFLSQSRVLAGERVKQYRYALQEFERGCLFFYFGATDQLAHIFWRDRDLRHPGLRPGEAERWGTVVEDCYVEMDGLVGEALAVLDEDDTLIIMSDHGFSTLRRAVNINTWLLNNGYLFVKGSPDDPSNRVFANIDWSRTRAYALGLNCFYINLKGRESNGIVEPGPPADALLHEIDYGLCQIRDTDGTPVIQENYIVKDIYPGADPQVAPDMLIGYADTYRASWQTALGDMPPTLIDDNLDRWSGTHLNAYDLVPGIVVTNRRIAVEDPELVDLGPTILSVFGIATPPQMTGHAVFVER
ncbi:MAG: alkaline phosphatase family protein [Planctomycetes bacterium]|nr:alkaline phosphatase family protein [Planctomycetota bacterium]